MPSAARCFQVAAIVVAAILLGLVLAYAAACVALAKGLSGTTIAWLGNGALALAVLAAIAAMRWRVWRRVVISIGAVCGAYVLYLVHDDPGRPAIDPGPIAPDSSPSYTAYRHFLKSGAYSRLAERERTLEALPRFAGKAEEWPKFVADNRTAFAMAWDKDTIGRGWINALAAAAPEGSFPVLSSEGPMLDFRSVRETWFVQQAHAQLLANDGDYDQAARALMNFLRAQYNLQRGGTMVVAQMIAMVMVRGAYDRLQPWVADRRLSAETRAALAAELAAAPQPPLVFHQAFVGEKLFVRFWADSVGVDRQRAAKQLQPNEGAAAFGAGWLLSLLYQPHRTERESFATIDKAEALMAARRLDELKQEVARNEAALAAFPWRNPVGIRLQQMSTPVFVSFPQNAWDTVDQRRALLELLAADQR